MLCISIKIFFFLFSRTEPDGRRITIEPNANIMYDGCRKLVCGELCGKKFDDGTDDEYWGQCWVEHRAV